MTAFNQYPAPPTLPLTGSEQLMLAQTNAGVSGTYTVTLAQLLAGGWGFSADSFVYAGSSGVLASTAAATNGQLLIGSTGAAPVAATLTGTANQITVTNGAGSITLSLPQNIHTGATPTFAGLTLSTTPLGVASGGTGVTAFAANYILYGNGTSALASSANFQILNDILISLNATASTGITPGLAVRGNPQAAIWIRRNATSDTDANATWGIGVDDAFGPGGAPTLLFGIGQGYGLLRSTNAMQLTITGLNSTAVGATTPSTGAFTTLTNGDTTALVKSSVSLNNGAGGSTATLTNAPAATNPTKWIPINDNGTTRYVPAW